MTRRMPAGVLSAREAQVVGLVAQGLTNQAVASRLALSPLTVKAHLARIRGVLGAPDRASVVDRAIRSGQLRVRRYRTAPPGLDAGLRRVLRLVALGSSTSQMAAALGVSENQAHYRVVRLFGVLGVGCRASAVASGFECGVLRQAEAPRAAPGAPGRSGTAAPGRVR